MTTLFETADVEAAQYILSNLYSVRRFSPQGDNPLLRIRQQAIGPVQLHDVTHRMSCDVEGDPLGALYFGHVIEGSITYHHGHDSRTQVAGDAFLVAQPDLPTSARVIDTTLECVAFDLTLLDQVAGTDPGRMAKPVEFTSYQPATPRDAKIWLSTCAYVRETFDPDISVVPQLILANIGRLLAATALSTFPNNALLEPTIEDRHDAHPMTVRRAVSFIEANAHRDISPAEIAAASHVTIRALQLAFRRHLRTTPTAYLRRVRLDFAHRELLVADPRITTIGDVAARWGFASHSRFAEHYRAAYGATPSQTLQRR